MGAGEMQQVETMERKVVVEPRSTGRVAWLELLEYSYRNLRHRWDKGTQRLGIRGLGAEVGSGGVRVVQGWEPSPGATSSCQLTALASASAHLGSVGCYPHPGSPIRKFPGILPEGLAELLVGGLEVLGQRLGRVPQGSQAQLPLQPLVGTALGRAGMRREGRVRTAGFDR